MPVPHDSCLSPHDSCLSPMIHACFSCSFMFPMPHACLTMPYARFLPRECLPCLIPFFPPLTHVFHSSASSNVSNLIWLTKNVCFSTPLPVLPRSVSPPAPPTVTPNEEEEGEEDEEEGSESKDLKPRKKKVRQPSEREKTKEHVNMVFIGHVGTYHLLPRGYRVLGLFRS